MSTEREGTLLHEWKNQTASDVKSFENYENYFDVALGTTVSKLETFPKFVRRQAISKFISRADIFRRVLDVHGSIVDCGVNAGCSLFTFAQLSAIFEPVNYTRKIIGFDTFEGITGVTKEDLKENSSEHVREGGFAAKGYFEDIMKGASLYDANRSLGHIPKVELVKGDIRKTLPDYVDRNPHLVVSLLHLDLDIYEPTKVAIEVLRPRMPKGAVIIFDELNQQGYPGETTAVLEALKISSLRIQRFPYETGISFCVLE